MKQIKVKMEDYRKCVKFWYKYTLKVELTRFFLQFKRTFGFI